MYLPLHNAVQKEYFFKVSVPKLGFFTVSLPLFAFVICVMMTMYKDFERANKTHCNVPNIFPSISASIGNYEPQIIIWTAAIDFHAPLRFFLIYLRWNYYRGVIINSFSFLVNISVFLNIIENLALVGLTHWTSSENYPYHEVCFKTFIATSVFYMLFVSIMLSKCRRRPNITSTERYSIKLKWRAFLTNVSSFGLAAFLFLRHNKLCEPYVYSMFGFSEYVVVISNMIFHLTTVYDLQMQFIYFTKNGVVIDK